MLYWNTTTIETLIQTYVPHIFNRPGLMQLRWLNHWTFIILWIRHTKSQILMLYSGVQVNVWHQSLINRVQRKIFENSRTRNLTSLSLLLWLTFVEINFFRRIDWRANDRVCDLSSHLKKSQNQGERSVLK